MVLTGRRYTTPSPPATGIAAIRKFARDIAALRQ